MTETPTSTARMPAQDRRKQLLETALDLFARHGFEGTTTKELAAAAGVTEAVIFRHFPSKQALYMAVLDYKTKSCELTNWLAQTKSCMERNDDEGLVRTIVLEILRNYRADPRLERVMLFAALEGHEVGLAHYRQFSLPIFELLRAYIARRQSEGAIRDCNPGLVIAGIAGMAQYFAMMTGLFGFHIEEDQQELDERAVDGFTAIVMKGIEKET